MTDGMAGDLLAAAVSLLLTFTRYRLFKDVGKPCAMLMLLLGFMATPLYLLNLSNDAAALLFARGADLLSAFAAAHRHAMVFFSAPAWTGRGVRGNLPGIVAVPVGGIDHAVGVPAALVGGMASPQGTGLSGAQLHEPAAAAARGGGLQCRLPCQLGEVAFMLWLRLLGARFKRSPLAAPA